LDCGRIMRKYIAAMSRMIGRNVRRPLPGAA
jgi:hypothetical protein